MTESINSIQAFYLIATAMMLIVAVVYFIDALNEKNKKIRKQTRYVAGI